MHPSVLEPFTARDGENLALHGWPVGAENAENGIGDVRGVVLLVHGLGEHAGRYQHVAWKLKGWGFAVRAYDQRGHGESSGMRGALHTDSALIDDLAEVVDDTRLRFKDLPLILLGHSMGGLVASHFVALNVRPVDGLVMSSPALDAGLSVCQKLLLAVSRRLAPNICINNGLDARYISRDERVVKAYQGDRLVHPKISPRLAHFIAAAGPATIAAAARWRVLTLLMYAGADRLVNPAGSRSFAMNASASSAVKPGLVTVKCFDGLYHEIFNEPEADSVFETLKAWLHARF